MGIINKDAASVYRYMNFDQIVLSVPKRDFLHISQWSCQLTIPLIYMKMHEEHGDLP
jgi:hypothetical protein